METESVAAIVCGHFNALAREYDNKSVNRANYLLAVDRLIIERLSLDGLEEGKVLDVGCATGRRAEMIFSAFPGLQVYGTDVSPNMVAAAGERNFTGLECGDMREINFPSGTFSAITCLFNVIGYLADGRQRAAALREFARVLKPGGLLFLDCMNRWHFGEGHKFRQSPATAVKRYLRSLAGGWSNRGNQLFDLPVAGQKVRGFVHGFSFREIKKLIKSGGFEITASYIIGYDSGQVKRWRWQGQYFFVARRM